MQKVYSLEKTLMLGGIEGRRRRGGQRMRWLDGITNSMDMSLSELGVGDGQGGLACCDSWGRKESDTTEQLNWTELIGATLVAQWYRICLLLWEKSVWSLDWEDLLEKEMATSVILPGKSHRQRSLGATFYSVAKELDIATKQYNNNVLDIYWLSTVIQKHLTLAPQN